MRSKGGGGERVHQGCRMVEKKHRRLTETVSHPSQEFVLPQVHSLDDVPAVVEHPPDVLRVHGTGEVGVAVMSAVVARSANPLKRRDKRRHKTISLTSSCSLHVNLVFTPALPHFNPTKCDPLRAEVSQKSLQSKFLLKA